MTGSGLGRYKESGQSPGSGGVGPGPSGTGGAEPFPVPFPLPNASVHARPGTRPLRAPSHPNRLRLHNRSPVTKTHLPATKKKFDCVQFTRKTVVHAEK